MHVRPPVAPAGPAQRQLIAGPGRSSPGPLRAGVPGDLPIHRAVGPDRGQAALLVLGALIEAEPAV